MTFIYMQTFQFIIIVKVKEQVKCTQNSMITVSVCMLYSASLRHYEEEMRANLFHV